MARVELYLLLLLFEYEVFEIKAMTSVFLYRSGNATDMIVDLTNKHKVAVIPSD